MIYMCHTIFSPGVCQEMSRLEHMVQDLNTELYNPVGLNIRWPRKVAFLFVSFSPYDFTSPSPSCSAAGD